MLFEIIVTSLCKANFEVAFELVTLNASITPVRM